MGKGEREVQGQASDEGEQEAGEWWGRARHRRMMGKSEREVRGQASDEGEQEAGEWWGRARDRRMMGKSRRDTQLMGEANDGEERETS